MQVIVVPVWLCLLVLLATGCCGMWLTLWFGDRPKVARLTSALDWYADKAHWKRINKPTQMDWRWPPEPGDKPNNRSWARSPAAADRGRRARAALGIKE